jgi:hypothetical protein
MNFKANIERHVKVLERNLWHSNSLNNVERRKRINAKIQPENNQRSIQYSQFRQHISIKDMINTKDNYENLEATQENLEILQ